MDFNIKIGDGNTITNNKINSDNIYNSPKAEEPNEAGYQQILSELQVIKARLDEEHPGYQMVKKLEDGAKKRNWSAITSTIKYFSGLLNSGLIADLAGSYLKKRLGL